MDGSGRRPTGQHDVRIAPFGLDPDEQVEEGPRNRLRHRGAVRLDVDNGDLGDDSALLGSGQLQQRGRGFSVGLVLVEVAQLFSEQLSDRATGECDVSVRGTGD